MGIFKSITNAPQYIKNGLIIIVLVLFIFAIILVVNYVKSVKKRLKKWLPWLFKDEGYDRALMAKPLTCPDSRPDTVAGLCYKKCENENYVPNGPMCWAKCPPNTVNIGTACTKKTYTAKKRPCSYYNNKKYKVKVNGRDKEFTYEHRDDGTNCWVDTLGRGAGHVKRSICENSAKKQHKKNKGKHHKTECERWGGPLGLWYPKCADGYKNVGCCLCEPLIKPGIKKTFGQRTTCNLDDPKNPHKNDKNFSNLLGICWAKCNDETINTGTQCEKKREYRGAGTIPNECRDEEEKIGLLCYPKCREGYKKGTGLFCKKEKK